MTSGGRGLPVLGLLVLVAGCAPEHSVLGRGYTLQVPASADGTTPLPLLVLLHGFGVNGIGQDILFPFSREVDDGRFLYAMPDGTADAQGKRYWNATDACCGDRALVDDVAFLTALVADVGEVHPVDPARVFLVGHSNGGYMALRMACDRPELVSGVVSVAGSTWDDFSRCGAGRPVAVLQVHGTRDTFVGYDGGTSSFGGSYPGAAGTTERFAGRNGCQPTRVAVEPLDLVGDGTAETRREVYPGCPDAGAVELWSIEGGGHLPFFKAGFYDRVLDWLGENAR